jgi:hypothetical protein
MMQVRDQVEECSRAEAFVAYLDRRWRGRRTDDQTDTVIRAIHLISPPEVWPPTVRIDFTINGREGVWEERWEAGLPDRGPVAVAADYFAQIAWEAFPEMQATGYVPDGLRFAD